MELFCQSCVDWLGGTESDPAEQYQTHLIINQWLPMIHETSGQQQQALILQQQRRYERYLRWRDTPQQIMKDPLGYVFITASWVAQWERFVEGWSIHPPSITIDNHLWRRLIKDCDKPSISFSPPSSFSPTDLVILSHHTWSYLAHTYSIIGPCITENDLQGLDLDKKWQYYKSRLCN
ncbi:uncharacterized protein BX664DRAFT_354085 [Halteromyces radiatus]|uniref:uncharacterized protein n=1 Tax=Halteromyces radiatus TaxID=101107 RepID=UPI002220671D|nr:uncharacterized protein BX664DRAFT_354085 [Halteromyces radiatus]KAI8098546.1 hypothetical protein BX664DRAFT_354085 [Halteromyces radiatus]